MDQIRLYIHNDSMNQDIIDHEDDISIYVDHLRLSKSIFISEEDFCSSLELFLNLRIGKIDT
jgi:hypothetical protein